MDFIGIDIGGTSIRIGMMDDDMKLHGFRKVPQQSVLSNDSPDGLAKFILDYINQYANGKKISALAVGAPATIDKDRSTILDAPNVEGLNGVNIRESLGAVFDFPVFLEKDVNMLFYYDLHRFQIDNSGVVIACYIGTGIGNAISIDGNLLLGSNGAAGELGHIPFCGSNEICGCGNQGCAETCAGGKRLDKLQRELFPNTPISRIFVEHKNDPALENYIQFLAITIATEINILDPITVVLGGGVISMEEFPKDYLIRNIRVHARKPMPEKNLQFILSDNSGENGVIGAGIFAKKMMDRERKA